MVPAAAPALSGAASGSAAGAALPADAKAPDALRNIGEVARLLGVKTHVLRYWESQFPALRPVKLA
ncbi:MAG TPA: MerR family transcriptional regulator, partial [Novosphingobium sp.]|nr:MerR family transcriptional regulator [Novosphingobium sp.]